MKPIDDPRFAEAVRLFEQDYMLQAEILTLEEKLSQLRVQARKIQARAYRAKPSAQTRISTLSKLHNEVFSRLDERSKVPFG